MGVDTCRIITVLMNKGSNTLQNVHIYNDFNLAHICSKSILYIFLRYQLDFQ